jgi:hypothetical protein
MDELWKEIATYVVASPKALGPSLSAPCLPVGAGAPVT